MGDDAGTVDFAVAVYHQDGLWRADAVSLDVVDSVDDAVDGLRRQAPEASDVIGMISVADDFFLLVRESENGTRLLLSDITAASEWPLARSVLDEIGVEMPEDDDEERVEPAGDLAIVADLGLESMELAALCSDLDLYPDEMLGSIASRLGFGEQFQRALDDARG